MAWTVRALLIGSALLWSAQAGATIFVDQSASYSYIDATGSFVAPGADWFQPSFNDSSWNVGSGPFSSGPVSGTIFDNGNVNGPFAPNPTQAIPTSFTQWDINHDPFLRTSFTLTAPTALTVWIAIDNGIGTAAGNAENGTGIATGMYINGVFSTNVGLVNAEGAAFRWENVFDIPASYTTAGTNVFALQLEDHGGATGFDMMITSEVDDSDVPAFTTNPPPTFPPPSTTSIPEPASLALFGAALTGFGFVRRKRSRA